MNQITKDDTQSMTTDIVKTNVEQLKSLFPDVFTEDRIDFDVLQSLLGEYVEKSDERYSFNWKGKSNARRITQTPSTATLRPAKEESKDWDKTENLYIEGDNLEVLKLLQKSYHNKIKMIYIDPPYNTGGDFIYHDDFKDNLNSYLELTKQLDKDGKKISTNSESSGRFHSNWLNMLYPRLKLARNLLKNDGVIFVSIDDNEVHNLRKLCDEIFGEENYVQEIIWEKKFAPQNDAQYFSLNHEQILCYAKNKPYFKRNLLPMTEEQISRYKNPDNDPRGVWQSDNLTVATYSENYDFPITKPNGEIINPPHGRCWRTSQDKFKELLADNRIWFGADNNGVPRIKRFLSEVQQGKVPISIFYNTEVGHTQEASKELKSLFGDKKYFDYPKPVKLIQQLIIIGAAKDDIILDFFSGSATTAHSVMKINAEDNGNRHYIMVQLPEPTDENSEAFKAGYKNICEIGKERIRRAGEKIMSDYRLKMSDEEQKSTQQSLITNQSSLINNHELDIGFKVFKLDTSNIKTWDSSTENIQQALLDSVSNIKENRSEDDLFYELLLKQGIDLTTPIEEYEVNRDKIYSCGVGTLIICLSKKISIEVVNKIAELSEEHYEKFLNSDDPEKSSKSNVIFRDNGFIDDVMKTNTIQILEKRHAGKIRSI